MARMEAESWPLDNYAGGTPLAALHAALAGTGTPPSLAWLAGMSGEAFLFFYDPAPVYEPQRDLRPVDTTVLAAQSAGYSGAWESHAQAATPAAIRAALEQRVAVVTSYLAPSWQTYQVITAIEVELPHVTVQMGEVREKVDVTTWDGAVTAGAGWLDRPLFILHRRGPSDDRVEEIRAALRTAETLVQGGAMSYPRHPGAQRFADIPLAGRSLLYGLPAFDALRDDLSHMSTPADVALIWRVVTQLGQLEHWRGLAHDFLYAACRPLEGQTASTLHGAASLYQQTAGLARQLRLAFWDTSLEPQMDLSTMHAHIQDGCSFVYAWPGAPVDNLWATPWGSVVIADDVARRQRAIDLVECLITNEKHALNFLASCEAF